MHVPENKIQGITLLRTFLVMAFLCLMLASPISAQTPTPTGSGDEALIEAVYAAIADRTPSSATLTQAIAISDIQRQNAYAFGMIVQRAGNTHEEPWLTLFLAVDEGGWQVALENSPEFVQLLERIPEGLVPGAGRALLRQNANSRRSAGNGSSLLSLPYALGEAWTLTGGPHSCCGGDATGQGALDLAGGTGKVRAAREGVVWRSANCPNFIRVDHADGWQTGYYHLINEVVNNGQGVARGQILGDQGAGVGCGGSATGPHVHFSLRFNGVAQSMNNHDVGGWNIIAGANQYEGCMRRIRDNFLQCRWGPIYNEGAIGSVGGTPLAPAGINVSTNGNFSGGMIAWSSAFQTSASIENGVLNWYAQAGGELATLLQVVDYTATAGSVVQLDLQLGNSSSVEKRIRAHVQSFDDGAGVWDSGLLVCEFIIPANAPLQDYTLRRQISTTWPQMRIWIEGYPPDGKPAILMDNVVLQRRTDISVTGTECIEERPGPITRLSPNNGQTLTAFTNTASFTWQEREDSTWYHFYLAGPGGYKFEKWVKGADYCTSGVCTLPDPPLLNDGSYSWWMAGWKLGRTGEYNKTTFTVNVPAPGSISLSTPADPYSDPPLTWQADPLATWYYLRFTRNGSALVDQWLKAADVCLDGLCQADRPMLLNGAYVWTMKAWGPGGMGPESSLSFSITEPAPAAISISSPSGSVPPTSSVQVVWPAEAHSMWYRLFVTNPGGQAYDQWLAREAVCVQDVCSTPVDNLTLGTHRAWIVGWGPGGMGTWSSRDFSTAP